jgi:hypothetical protein
MNQKSLHEELFTLGLKHKDKTKLINHALYYCKSNTKKLTDDEFKKLSKDDKLKRQEERKQIFLKVHYQWKLASQNLKKSKIDIVKDDDFKDFVKVNLKLTNIF